MMSIPAKLFFILSSIVIIGYLLSIGQSILVPFVIAVFFWYLINAVAHKITEFTKFNYNISKWLSILLIVLLVSGFVNLTQDNVQSFVSQLPDYQKNVEQLFSKYVSALGLLESNIAKEAISNVQIGQLAGGIALALGNIATMTVTILLYLVFLFLEQASFKGKVKALFPQKTKYKKIDCLLSDIGDSIEAYIGLKTLASVIMGVIGYIILIILGVDHAIFWALIFGVLNFIPYIGPVVGVVFPVLAALVQFGDFSNAAIIAISFTLIAFIIGNIVEPKLFGHSLNLSPLVLMLSLSVWGSLWGVIGMILSVPLMVGIMIVLSHFDATRPYAVLMSEKEEHLK